MTRALPRLARWLSRREGNLARWVNKEPHHRKRDDHCYGEEHYPVPAHGDNLPIAPALL